MDASLRELAAQTEGTAEQRRMLDALVTRLEVASAVGLAAKLREYKGKPTENVIAELAMGEALSIATRSLVHFQSGEAHDLRLRNDTLDCTVEVEHKSSVSTFSAVFYAEPDLLVRYRDAAELWKRAAWRLDEAVRASQFEVQPWIGAALAEPFWSYSERKQQEHLCAEVAEWLAEELAKVPAGKTSQLAHEHARFDLKPVEGPGRICGYGPLKAYELRSHDDVNGVSLSGWLRYSIEHKAKKSARHPERRGKQHLVGLVIDEAYACTGHLLASVILGGLVAAIGETPAESRRYREFPIAARSLLNDAIARGRQDLLALMKFEPRPRLLGREPLTVDEEVYQNLDGVVALYYTRELQFIPIPFAISDIEPMCAAFPRTLDPFALP